MPTNIITSHHNLERESLSHEECKDGAPHRVRCLTCKTDVMSLEEAEAHAALPAPDWAQATYRLFTIFP